MKPLVVIPARGGSKGVPRKNIRLLGEKPLIQYTIEAAREIFPDEVICVSTDDLEIKQIVENMGLEVPFLRPAELSTDEASTHDVLIHAINYYKSKGYYPDTLILLQATSPLRTGNHIKEALELFDNNCEMVVSVKESKANPYFNLFEEDEFGLLKKSKEGDFTRRQECPLVFEYNGAIYIYKTNGISSQDKRIKKYLMTEKDSVDIDTEIDLLLIENILTKRINL